MQLFNRRKDFESSVREELPTLYRVARRMARTGEEAEDLVSQTLLQACKAWDRFDGKHLRSWLVRIMRNELVNQARRAAARPQTTVLEDYVAEDDSFWNQLNWKSDAKMILEELENLSDEHKMIIQFCDVEELSYQEVADILDIPMGTVRSRLFRARHQLRRKLSHLVDTESTTSS